MGAALRRLRESTGMSQVEVQRRAKMASSSLSDYETGKSEPQQRTLVALLGAMGYSLHDLDRAMKETGDPAMPRRGVPDPKMAAALAQHAFDETNLRGFVYAAVAHGPQGVADLEASLREAAPLVLRRLADAASAELPSGSSPGRPKR